MSKLEAVSITKSFGDNTILQDVSLRLEPREIVCLLGVSGGGKTTLFNVLSGLTMMAIPYAVTGVLTVLVTMLFGGFEPVGVLVTVLGVIGESLFFFGLATFCAFIVGNVFMLPALYGLLNFIAVLTAFMVNLLPEGLLLRPEQQLFRYCGVAQPRGIPRAEDLSQQHLRDPVGDGSTGRSAV